jgi:prepilin-type N-terminal cleavage/methylation domain-containing protein
MNNKKGYTLIELIITLAVIGIMIIPIFNSFISSHRINLQSKRSISAAYAAQSQVEFIKSRSFIELKDLFNKNIDDPFPEGSVINYTSTMDNAGNTFDVTCSIDKHHLKYDFLGHNLTDLR